MLPVARSFSFTKELDNVVVERCTRQGEEDFPKHIFNVIENLAKWRSLAFGFRCVAERCGCMHYPCVLAAWCGRVGRLHDVYENFGFNV